MRDIKNIELLNELSAMHLQDLQQKAHEYAGKFNITFKVLENIDDVIVIRVSQGECEPEQFLSKKRLNEIGKHLFGSLFPDKKILIRPLPYNEPVVNMVTIQWIQYKMMETGIKLKDIATDTGISRAELLQIHKGEIELTQQQKAFFYYYFMAHSMKK